MAILFSDNFTEDVLIISEVSPGFWHTVIVHYGHILLILTLYECYD